MSKRLFAIAFCLLAIWPNAKHIALGASGSAPDKAPASDEDWWKDVTVLAIAPDGTWGVGIDKSFDRAVAQALAACKRKYRKEVGCGYRQTSIRGGWSLMYRCGDENIIAAEKKLPDAVQQARRQEFQLRMHYEPEMPRCERIVTVDPQGNVTSNGKYSGGYLNAAD